jgi:sulfur carrier protein ThiS
MAVTLIIAGGLREYVGARQRVEMAVGLTLGEMIQMAGIPPALVAGLVRGDELLSKDYRPEEGETIKIIAVMGGG